MIPEFRKKVLKSYASNEIRYRGFYSCTIDSLMKGYVLYEDEARYMKQLINECVFVFDGEVFTG